MKDIMGLMSKAKEMQEKMQAMQEELASLETEGSKGAAFLSLAGSTFFACSDNTKQEESEEKNGKKKLNILILGGTSFLGPHQIAYALGRGHSISTFTRGKTKPGIYPELFEQVESLIGDREDNLEALKGRKWDAVIDNSGRKVEWTKATAELLKDNVGLYLYTSSTGVFYPYLDDDIKEDHDLVLEMPEGIEDEEMKMEYGYGVMKANSEIAAKEAFGADRCIIVRPTYMVGPADKTDRFIYWPVRLNKGGEVLVPGKKDDPVQFIDVRDVAAFMIGLIETKQTGTFNAAGPAEETGMRKFVEQAHQAYSSEASFVQVDDYDFLLEHKIPYLIPWIMPTGNNYGSARINNAKAIAHGLSFTPLEKTMKNTLAWWMSEAVAEERRQKIEDLIAGEMEVLDAWKVKA